LTNKIRHIKIYPEKGSKGELLSQANLQENEGIVGDRHSDISLLTTAAQLFKEQNPGGLCFARFKENILIDADLHGIDHITIGDAVLGLGAKKKICIPECSHYKTYFLNGKKCPFSEGVAFARVLKGGAIASR